MSTDTHDDPSEQPILFGWNRAELITLLIGVAIILIWAVSYTLFGFAGLIVPALFYVFVMFVALVLISLGN